MDRRSAGRGRERQESGSTGQEKGPAQQGQTDPHPQADEQALGGGETVATAAEEPADERPQRPGAEVNDGRENE
jgi:hypothetical protein